MKDFEFWEEMKDILLPQTKGEENYERESCAAKLDGSEGRITTLLESWGNKCWIPVRDEIMQCVGSPDSISTKLSLPLEQDQVGK